MNIDNTLIGQNILAVIRNINTSVYSQMWFVQNRIFTAESEMEDEETQL